LFTGRERSSWWAREEEGPFRVRSRSFRRPAYCTRVCVCVCVYIYNVSVCYINFAEAEEKTCRKIIPRAFFQLPRASVCIVFYWCNNMCAERTTNGVQSMSSNRITVVVVVVRGTSHGRPNPRGLVRQISDERVYTGGFSTCALS